MVDGGYLAAVAAAEAELQVSTVIETTLDGDVLVGSSRERKGFDTSVDPAVTARAAGGGGRGWCPRCAVAASSSAALGRPAPVAARRPPGHRAARGRGIWVATGHEGAGVGLGPITGELIAAAISGERLPLDLAPFDPDRFAQTERATAPRPPSDSRMTRPSATCSISASSALSGSGSFLSWFMTAATS